MHGCNNVGGVGGGGPSRGICYGEQDQKMGSPYSQRLCMYKSSLLHFSFFALCCLYTSNKCSWENNNLQSCQMKVNKSTSLTHTSFSRSYFIFMVSHVPLSVLCAHINTNTHIYPFSLSCKCIPVIHSAFS